MAIDLGLPINTRVSPSLHPQMVASLEVFDEDTKSTLGPVVEAFDVAYNSIAQVFAAREAVQSDPTLTEAAQILKAADFSETMMKRAAATFDKVSANLKQIISTYEKSLSEPVVARAAQPIAQEIRAHVKAMDSGKRMSFITAAIDTQDHDAVTAVLGAPAFLSGITSEMSKVLLTMYHERANPPTAKRLKAAKAGLALLDERAGMLFGQMEKAVGAPPSKVKALRAAKAASDKRFNL